jgi:hypothetical protein
MPVIRVIHHMARSGGTIICRCLASMENVVLLSEIHPQGTGMFNPLQQAADWHGLMNAGDAREFAENPPDFIGAISRIEQRCRDAGKQLVIRDWSHLDYTGLPFGRPSYRPVLAETLAPHFLLHRVSTVRHPVDQWLSITRHPRFRASLQPGSYLEGCLAFAREAVRTGFFRYEDFTADPDGVLEALCAALELPFDPGYRDRWRNWDRITGDVLPGRAGSKIRSLPRQDENDGRLAAITGQAALPEILGLLGYAERDPEDAARL